MFISAWPKERLTIRPWEPVTGRIHWQFEWNLSHVYTYIHLIIIPNLVLPVLYTTDMIANAKLWYLYTISYLLYEGGSRIEENNWHLWKHSYHLWEFVKSLGVCEIGFTRFGSGIFLLAAAPRFFPNKCRREYQNGLRWWSPSAEAWRVRKEMTLEPIWQKFLQNTTHHGCFSHKHIHTHFCCLPIQHT